MHWPQNTKSSEYGTHMTIHTDRCPVPASNPEAQIEHQVFYNPPTLGGVLDVERVNSFFFSRNQCTRLCSLLRFCKIYWREPGEWVGCAAPFVLVVLLSVMYCRRRLLRPLRTPAYVWCQERNWGPKQAP